MENENEFEFIKGYENLYKINRKGEIWSCWYQKVMAQMTKEEGYKYVSLKKDGVYNKGYIHRLLLLQYIENPENKPQVDHIDRNPANNDLSNLRWVTSSEQRDNRSRKGCVYEVKRKDGKIYWKSTITIGRGTERKILQKTCLKKEDVEKWLEEMRPLAI